MKTQLPARSESHKHKFEQITNTIISVGKGRVAFVILFGSFARGDWVKDRYKEKHITYSYVSDYDILVLTTSKGKNKRESDMNLEHEIDEELSKRGFDKIIPLGLNHNITLVVDPLFEINKKLEQEQYFYSDIIKEGILLYKNPKYELAKPRKLNNQEKKKIAQEFYDYWFKNGSNFLKYCNLFLEEKGDNYHSLSITAFELHKATEDLYSCVLLIFTNYKPKTHDIEELNKLCIPYSKSFLDIFPKKYPEQIECFKLLKTAYIDARYNMDYRISIEQIKYLITRVEELKDLVEEICMEKINSF